MSSNFDKTPKWIIYMGGFVSIATIISVIIAYFAYTKTFDTSIIKNITPTSVKSSTTATPAPSLLGTLPCQADWSNGLDGWTRSQDWKVLNGQLLNDGSKGSLDPRPTIIAPCQAKETADYRVEVIIKVVRGCVCFDFATVRGTATSNGWTGYKGIVSDGFLQIRDSNNKILTQTVFDPGTIEHTYASEVKGTNIKVFVDGGIALETNDNLYLTGGQVGMKSFHTQLVVTAFRVTAV